MILRAARSTDVDALLDVQQPAAIEGLGHIFPQDGSIRGFAAIRSHKLLHFGTAYRPGEPAWPHAYTTR
jgi:hypothetical protein